MRTASPLLDVRSQNGSESDPEGSRIGRSKLKPVLNPIHPQDSQMFAGTDREFKVQGLALSPVICANLVQDLNTSKGKGATIFAKRRKKSEKWIVDECKVQSMMIPGVPSGAQLEKKNPSDAIPSNRLESMIQDDSWMTQPSIRYVKSPWEAALESPIGNCDAAFEVTNYRNRMAPRDMPPVPTNIIKARLPEMLNLDRQEQDNVGGGAVRMRRTAAAVYTPKAPKGWTRSLHGNPSSIHSVTKVYIIYIYNNNK